MNLRGTVFINLFLILLYKAIHPTYKYIFFNVILTHTPKCLPVKLFFNRVLREKMYCIVNLKNFPYRSRSTKTNLAYLLDVKYPKIHNKTGIYEFKEKVDLTYTQPCKMNLLLIILEIHQSWISRRIISWAQLYGHMVKVMGHEYVWPLYEEYMNGYNRTSYMLYCTKIDFVIFVSSTYLNNFVNKNS